MVNRKKSQAKKTSGTNLVKFMDKSPSLQFQVIDH